MSLFASQTKNQGDYQPLRLSDVNQQKDVKVLVHQDLVDWIDEKGVSNEHVRSEIFLAYRRWVACGRFQIHQERFEATSSAYSRRLLVSVLRECPHIQLLKPGKPGKSAAIYVFRLAGTELRPDRPTDKRSSRFPFVLVFAGHSCHRVIAGSWLFSRAKRWSAWCDRLGLDNKCDFFGLSRLARAVFRSLANVSLPTDVSYARKLSAKREPGALMSPRQNALFTHDRLLEGTRLKLLKQIDGRCYTPVTNVSRLLREQFRIRGEPVVEVDLKCSYPTLLASQMPPCRSRERDRLLDTIRAGTLYEDVASAAGVRHPDRDELKREFQRQVVFPKDLRLSQRPLAVGLKRLFPAFARMIERLRRQCGGASEFSRFLTRLEGRVMGTAHHWMIDRGIDFLPLHDAVIVAKSNVDTARQLVEQAVVDALGFEGRVAVKGIECATVAQR